MASNPTTPLTARELFLNNNNHLDYSFKEVSPRHENPRISIEAAKFNDDGGRTAGKVSPTSASSSGTTTNTTVTTRIPIARNGSIRRMRNSKSFSNDHQLSRSLTRAEDHYYVSSFHNNKSHFLTLNKFGSVGNMHKACSSASSAGSSGVTTKNHVANGDCTDSSVTATIRQNHKLTTTNGKYCNNSAERSMVSVWLIFFAFIDSPTKLPEPNFVLSVLCHDFPCGCGRPKCVVCKIFGSYSSSSTLKLPQGATLSQNSSPCID